MTLTGYCIFLFFGHNIIYMAQALGLLRIDKIEQTKIRRSHFIKINYRVKNQRIKKITLNAFNFNGERGKELFFKTCC